MTSRSDLERQSVVDYMFTQAPDQEVTHAEMLTSERVWGTDHGVWDVHTDKGRWWVITGMTNLYSQDDFKSMDGVLSFHLGLTARVAAQQSRQGPSDPDPKLEITRRQWEQAAEEQNEADEAEAFQAVGMRCREALVFFTHAMASDELVGAGHEAPKLSDFVHWSELIANAVAPGSRNDDLRSCLKSEAKATWGFVNGLTHQKRATRLEGDLAVQLTGHFLSIYEQLIHHRERRVPDACPECGSYQVEAFWTRDEEDDDRLLHSLSCGACDWWELVESESLHYPTTEEVEAADSIKGDCTPTSGLGPGVSKPQRRR